MIINATQQPVHQVPLAEMVAACQGGKNVATIAALILSLDDSARLASSNAARTIVLASRLTAIQGVA
jgi:hypothetical protein